MSDRPRRYYDRTGRSRRAPVLTTRGRLLVVAVVAVATFLSLWFTR